MDSYAIICGEIVLILEPKVFSTWFLPLLIALASDEVVNVRLSVADTLRNKVSKNGSSLYFPISFSFFLLLMNIVICPLFQKSLPVISSSHQRWSVSKRMKTQKSAAKQLFSLD